MAAITKVHEKMSYADCFAAALAKLKRAQLVTGNGNSKRWGERYRYMDFIATWF